MTARALPEAISALTGELPYRLEEIGRSGAEIRLYESMVLKIEKTSPASDNEYEVLRFLEGKLPVPRVLAFSREDGMNHLLMTRLSGTMACDTSLSHETVVRALAAGLKMLWQVELSDHPAMRTVESELMLARDYRENGTPSPETKACLDSLFEDFPADIADDIPVFSHGDYCLPNVFLRDGVVWGFLDLGGGGIAGKWYDIATCLWSMHYNFSELGQMDEKTFAGYREMLFRELGMEPNEEKLRFYDLLNETVMRIRSET